MRLKSALLQALLLCICLIALVSCSSLPTSSKKLPQATQQADTSKHIARSQKNMVVTQGPYSTQAGLKMLELGGNAIDAAAAVSFSIGVERPQSTGIGGGGFLLFHSSAHNTPLAFDFRETAPRLASQNMYLDSRGQVISNKSLDGIYAIAVPGLVRGILEIHQKYGKLSRATVLAPAIELAEKGFAVYPELAFALKEREPVLKQFPASKEIFFASDDSPLKEGDWLTQKDLAKTLKAIALNGDKGFYQGWVAKAIVKESQQRGGLLTEKDLLSYKPKQRQPVSGSYGDFKIYSMPPPSSGGVHVIQILNILEPYKLRQYGPASSKSIHLASAAMQAAFADRAKYLGDPDFVEVPSLGLSSKNYAEKIRSQIPMNKARKIQDVQHGDPWPHESTETTHFSIIDNEGQVVVSTQTINGFFGSGLVAPGTGVVLNNEMDDFAAQVGASNLFGALGGEKNLIAPGKRPLSSMAPTIVLGKNNEALALGSPSGTRILTCVAQTILNVLEYGLDLPQAVATIRYHHQYSPDYIRVDEPGFPTQIQKDLENMGYDIKVNNLGCRIQAIHKTPNEIIGISDPRGAGQALGSPSN